MKKMIIALQLLLPPSIAILKLIRPGPGFINFNYFCQP